MPYKRSGSHNHLIVPTVPGYGRLPERRSSTRRKQIATAVEVLLRELPTRGYGRLVDRNVAGEIITAELYVANREKRLDELLIRAEDPPLDDAVAEVRARISDDRVRTGLEQLLDYAPKGARLSWLIDPQQIQALCDRAVKNGRKPNTVRRSLYRAISDLLQIRLGKKGRDFGSREGPWRRRPAQYRTLPCRDPSDRRDLPKAGGAASGLSHFLRALTAGRCSSCAATTGTRVRVP